MNPTSNYLTCAGREVHFMGWGTAWPALAATWTNWRPA